MPTLAGWLASGSHRPGRLGVRHPVDDDEFAGGHPARRQLGHPGLLLVREARAAADVVGQPARSARRPTADSRTGSGLLHDDGVSVTNLFSGDAELRDHDRRYAHRRRWRAAGRAPRLLRLPAQSVQPVPWARRACSARRCSNAGRRSASGSRTSRPRRARAGLFALQRGCANIVLRDATTWAVVASMYRGRRIIYCDYVGYDEVAHYAGPETRDAVATLAEHRPPVATARAGRPRGAAPVPVRRALRSRPDDGAAVREPCTASGSTSSCAS